jgi:hypothetical protein
MYFHRLIVEHVRAGSRPDQRIYFHYIPRGIFKKTEELTLFSCSEFRIKNHLNLIVLELGLSTAEILSKCRENGRKTLASFQQVRGLAQSNTGAPVIQAHPCRFRKKNADPSGDTRAAQNTLPFPVPLDTWCGSPPCPPSSSSSPVVLYATVNGSTASCRGVARAITAPWSVR